jgi:hypothetical protein
VAVNELLIMPTTNRCLSVKGEMSLQKTDSDDFSPFSQRYNITPNQKGFQLESMDDALRNQLWNCIYYKYLKENIELCGNFAYEPEFDS